MDVMPMKRILNKETEMNNDQKILTSFTGKIQEMNEDNAIEVDVVLWMVETDKKSIHYSITAKSQGCNSMSGKMSIAPAVLLTENVVFNFPVIKEICFRIQNENAFFMNASWNIFPDAMLDAHAIAAGYTEKASSAEANAANEQAETKLRISQEQAAVDRKPRSLDEVGVPR